MDRSLVVNVPESGDGYLPARRADTFDYTVGTPIGEGGWSG